MRGLAFVVLLTALLSALLVSCVPTALPVADGPPGPCAPGSYDVRSAIRCERDADCLLCGRPTGCGELTSRSALATTNQACPRPDADACQGRVAACCGGRCVLSLGPPPL